MARYLEAIEDPSDDQFSEMFSYFANYLKAFTSVNEQTVASYLVVQEIVKRISAVENPAKFTFAELYSEIESKIHKTQVHKKHPPQENVPCEYQDASGLGLSVHIPVPDCA